MSSEALSLWTETSSDPELIAGVRAGDTAAFGVLYERHVDAARKVAAVYTNSASDVDDVVSEAFSRVLRALQRGDGPDLAFRAYLFTIVRRTGMDTIDKGIRTKPRDDMSEYEASIGFEPSSDEPALEGFEHGLVADAFKSLPERWQAVLWYTEVEKKSPREIAPLLGLSANGVAALSYRAREALRQAYLQQHLNAADTVNCLEANTHLGSYVRGGLSKREHQQVDAHVVSCEKCSALVAELEDVNRGMRGVIAPLILGAAALGILEGGLPVGGAFAHTGTASTGAGAGGVGGVGGIGGGVTATTVAGVTGTASSATGVTTTATATVSTSTTTVGAPGLMSTLGSAFSSSLTVILPAIALTAAVVLVFNIAAVFTPQEQGGEPPAVAAPTTADSDTDPGSNDGNPNIDQPVVDPNNPVGEPPAPSPEPDSPRPGQQPTTTPNPQPTATPNPQPTATPNPQPTATPNPQPTIIPDPQPTVPPKPTPTQPPVTDPDPDPTPDPDPEPTPDPDPDPTPPPPTGTPRLALGTSALDYLTISRAAPKVTIDVSNDGDATAESVTATVDIPDGLAFATPTGGAGGQGIASAVRLSAFASYALAQHFTTPDGWQCSLNSERTVATCELDQITGGSSVPLTLGVEVLVNGQLSADAMTTFSLTHNEDHDSYSVRTGLLDFDPQLTPVYVHDGPAAATQVGAPLMGCDPSHHQCESTMSFNGNAAQDRYNNAYWNKDGRSMIALNEAGGERNSATTVLTTAELPAGSTVLYATLKWSSVRGATDEFDGALDSARILAPGSTEYMDVVADAVQHSTGHGITRFYYQSTANITELVAQHGVGEWSLADIALPSTRNDVGATYYGGFTITIVYEHPDLQNSRVALFEGDQWVRPGQPFSFPFSMHSKADVQVGLVAWEGQRGTLNDLLRICDNLANTTPCGMSMTPYGHRGMGDSGNIADSTARGSKWANTLGVDAKSFRPEKLPGRDHVLWAETSADPYMIGTLTVTIAYDD